MAKYLLKVSYSADGLRGVMKDGGTARVKAVETALAGVGGSLETFYFAFGQDDVYVIADVPDHAAAMAMAATVGASVLYRQLRDGRAALAGRGGQGDGPERQLRGPREVLERSRRRFTCTPRVARRDCPPSLPSWDRRGITVGWGSAGRRRVSGERGPDHAARDPGPGCARGHAAGCSPT